MNSFKLILKWVLAITAISVPFLITTIVFSDTYRTEDLSMMALAFCEGTAFLSAGILVLISIFEHKNTFGGR
jgi:hypothetical protein